MEVSLGNYISFILWVMWLSGVWSATFFWWFLSFGSPWIRSRLAKPKKMEAS